MKLSEDIKFDLYPTILWRKQRTEKKWPNFAAKLSDHSLTERKDRKKEKFRNMHSLLSRRQRKKKKRERREIKFPWL